MISIFSTERNLFEIRNVYANCEILIDMSSSMSLIHRQRNLWQSRLLDLEVIEAAMSTSATSETDSKAPLLSSSKRNNYVTTIDKSQANRGFLQYLAVWICIGWIFFYLVFMGSLPFLYYYAPTLLTTVVWLMIFSAFMPIDERCQPKVSKVHSWESSVGFTLLLLS